MSTNEKAVGADHGSFQDDFGEPSFYNPSPLACEPADDGGLYRQPWRPNRFGARRADRGGRL
jgi:hypothetical protein